MLRRLPSLPAGKSSPDRRRPRFRPSVEALGERIVPVLSPVANPVASTFVPAVGKVTGINFSTGDGYLGTGTLIADRWVLTAAHCVDASWTSDLHFLVNGATYNVDDRYAVTAGNLDPSWDSRNYDIGLMHLTQSVPGVTPVPIYRGGLSAGLALTVVGFGDTDNGTHKEVPGTADQRRAGKIYVDALPNTDEGYQTIIRTVYGKDAGGSATGHGDSGGPLLGVVGGRTYVVGVVSHQNTKLGPYATGSGGETLMVPGSVEDNIRVAPFGGWLDRVIGTQTQPTTRWAADTGGAQAPGVQDVTPPVIWQVPTVNVRATDAGGARVTFSAPPVTDDYDLNPTVTLSRPSGSLFPVGITAVTVTATDASGNVSKGVIDVIVSGNPVDIGVDSGSHQGFNWWDYTPVLGRFPDALVATVLDADGNPVVDAPVVFTAPTSGPSCTFANGATTITVLTNAEGHAIASGVTANTAAGSYDVTIATTGLNSSFWNPRFSLNNSPGPAAQVQVTGGNRQSATVNTAFDTLRATVTDAYGNPTGGTVTFAAPPSGAAGTFSNGETVTTVEADADGVAAVEFTANGEAGDYEVTALASCSWATFDLRNTPLLSTSVALVTSGAAAASGQAVTFTATVASGNGTPTGPGTVSFFDGGDWLGTAPLRLVNGVTRATFTSADLALGAHAITASYAGDDRHSGSVSPALTETITAPARVVAVSTPPAATVGTPFAAPLRARVLDQDGKPLAGVSVTFRAPTSGPTGTFDGSAIFTTTTDVDGVAGAMLTAGGQPGDFVVTASAAGVDDPAVFSLTALRDESAAATTTALRSSAPVSPGGHAVTFTATVKADAGVPTGSVLFYDGRDWLGTGVLRLVNGVARATLTVSNLTAGVHILTAVYVGDDGHAGSTSAALIQKVVGSPPPRPVSAELVSQKWGITTRLGALVRFAPQIGQNGRIIVAAPRAVVSPFQLPTFRRVAVALRDLNGDGVNDALVFTALRGWRRVSRIVRL